MERLNGNPVNCHKLGDLVHEIDNNPAAIVKLLAFRELFEKGEFDEYIKDLNDFRCPKGFKPINLNQQKAEGNKMKNRFITVFTAVIALVADMIFGEEGAVGVGEKKKSVKKVESKEIGTSTQAPITADDIKGGAKKKAEPIEEISDNLDVEDLAAGKTFEFPEGYLSNKDTGKPNDFNTKLKFIANYVNYNLLIPGKKTMPECAEITQKTAGVQTFKQVKEDKIDALMAAFLEANQ